MQGLSLSVFPSVCVFSWTGKYLAGGLPDLLTLQINPMWKKTGIASWLDWAAARSKREMKSNGLMIVQDDATKWESAGGEGCVQDNDKLQSAFPTLGIQPRRTSLAFWTGRMTHWWYETHWCHGCFSNTRDKHWQSLEELTKNAFKITIIKKETKFPELSSESCEQETMTMLFVKVDNTPSFFLTATFEAELSKQISYVNLKQTLEAVIVHNKKYVSKLLENLPIKSFLHHAAFTWGLVTYKIFVFVWQH